jgi:hypothetical protein
VLVSAFPDLRFTIDQILAEGDFVVNPLDGDGHAPRRADGHRADRPPHRDARVHGRRDQERPRVRDWVDWDTGHLLKPLGVLR